MRSLLLLSLYLPLVSACQVDPNLKATAQVGWFKRTATTIGDIGGGVDSVALWLAIAGLVLLPVASIVGALIYQHVLRPRRIVKESSPALAGNGNGKHDGP